MTLPDLTGRQLGQYQLRNLMGSGGMGTVYRAYQPGLDREVAIKVISASLLSRENHLERFYREARTAASLEHGNIVPVYDFGTESDISYVVMRLLGGGTLAQRLEAARQKQHPLPDLTEITGFLDQIARALDYAHQRGVIHRDIKPGNIMFDESGTPFIVDFGIARVMGATSALTGTRVAMGTPSYMAPEQWRGENIVPATDQYATAIVIYNMVTGQVPFTADTPYALMHKHINEIAAPVNQFRETVPEAVTAVLRKAMAKISSDRYSTMIDFARAFADATVKMENRHTGFFTLQVEPEDIPPGQIPPQQYMHYPAPNSPQPTPPPEFPVNYQTPPQPPPGFPGNTPPPGTPPGYPANIPLYTPGYQAPGNIAPPRRGRSIGLGIAFLIAVAIIGIAAFFLFSDRGIDDSEPEEEDTILSRDGTGTPTEVPAITYTSTATMTHTLTATASSTATATRTLPVPTTPVTPTVDRVGTQVEQTLIARDRTLTAQPTRTPPPSPTQAPTLTPRPTSTATRTPAPTLTPHPTSTATWTPAPTLTPRPSFTWTSIPSRTPFPSDTPDPIRSLIPDLNGTVLEITEAGSRLNARRSSSTSSTVLDQLLWGDRVLWRGERIINSEGTWREIYLGNGQLAYIIENSRYYVPRDVGQITPGISIGDTIVITSEGSGMRLRRSSSTYATLLETLRQNDRLTVIGGPVYAEYYIWWQLRMPDGQSGWSVDVPGWWRVQ